MSLVGRVKKNSKKLDLTRATVIREMRRRNLKPNKRVTLVGTLLVSFVGGMVAQRSGRYFVGAAQQHLRTMRNNMTSIRRQWQTAQSLLKMFV